MRVFYTRFIVLMSCCLPAGTAVAQKAADDTKVFSVAQTSQQDSSVIISDTVKIPVTVQARKAVNNDADEKVSYDHINNAEASYCFPMGAVESEIIRELKQGSVTVIPYNPSQIYLGVPTYLKPNTPPSLIFIF